MVMSSMRNRDDSKSIGIENAHLQIYSHWEISLPYHHYISPQDRIALWRDYYNIVVTTHANHWYRDQVIMPPTTREAAIGLAMVLSNNPNKAKIEDMAGFILDNYWQSERSRVLGHLARVSTLGRPVASPIKLTPGNIDRPRIFIDWAVSESAPDVGRLWKTLLHHWSGEVFAKQLLVLDRGGAAPKFSTIHYQDAPAYDESRPQPDRRMLQDLCDRLGADLFVSAGDSTPVTTASSVVLADQVPLPPDPSKQITVMPAQQHIGQAATFIALSAAAEKQMRTLYPQANPGGIVVAQLGVGEEFHPRPAEEIDALRQQFSISRLYFLIAGPCTDNPNTRLLFEALNGLPDADQLQLVCAAASPPPKELADLLGKVQLNLLNLTDDELAAAYSGAIALLHVGEGQLPSLTALEAMTCGCPIIAWPCDALTEIAGEAAMFVQQDNAGHLAHLFTEVRKPDARDSLIQRGFERSGEHSGKAMAAHVHDFLMRTFMAIHNSKAAS
jgi:glycosyltransferase involved in cell wall biosynthesis